MLRRGSGSARDPLLRRGIGPLQAGFSRTRSVLDPVRTGVPFPLYHTDCAFDGVDVSPPPDSRPSGIRATRLVCRLGRRPGVCLLVIERVDSAVQCYDIRDDFPSLNCPRRMEIEASSVAEGDTMTSPSGVRPRFGRSQL